MSKAVKDLGVVHDQIYNEYSKLENKMLGSLKWCAESGLSYADRQDLNKASKEIKRGLSKLLIAIKKLDKEKK